MASIKRRKFTVTSGGVQVYQGACLVVAAVFDHNAASSSNVVTLYDGNSTSDTAMYARTSDTDAGTTVPLPLYTDGYLPATFGTAAANGRAGVPFRNGVYLVKSGDTTHADVYTFFIKPLIKKTVAVRTVGSAGSAVGGATIFDGPGLLHALYVAEDAANPSTLDFLVKDSPMVTAAGVGSGNTLVTATDWGSTGAVLRGVAALTGSDEAGNAVTTASTGAYASPGIFFATGLNVSVQQGNALDRALVVEALIEA